MSRMLWALVWAAGSIVAAGCGTTKQQTATEQLIVSDAVDQAVAHIGFQPLAGRAVYLDTEYIKAIKGIGFVNAPYIISSLRQQMVAAGCLLMDDREDAEIIVEARVGTLGTNGNELIYGIPASSRLSTAASLVPGTPPIPAIPEISLARKNVQAGAAKIAVFAYYRESREPVWQSGIAQSRSSSQDFWVFGAGPFRRGTIHRKKKGLTRGMFNMTIAEEDPLPQRSNIAFDEPFVFNPGIDGSIKDGSRVELATHEDPADNADGSDGTGSGELDSGKTPKKPARDNPPEPAKIATPKSAKLLKKPDK